MAEQTGFRVGELMKLLQRLKHDVRAGVAKLRYGTVQVAQRALEETELLQLRFKVRRLDSRINELYRELGERAVELHAGGASAQQVLADPEIGQHVEQALALKTERAKLLDEMDDVRNEADSTRH